MLVNISYSIGFDEVPGVISKFLQDDIRAELTQNILSKVEESLAYLEQENFGKTIQTVEEARQLLAKIDMRLHDCSNILRGYHSELLSPSPQQSDSPADHDAPELKVMSTTAGLQEDLSKLRAVLKEGTDDFEDR